MSAPVVIAELQKCTRERVRVSLVKSGSNDLVDVRITTRFGEAADVWAPTKTGLSMRVSMIPALREALAKAEARALEMGILDE